MLMTQNVRLYHQYKITRNQRNVSCMAQTPQHLLNILQKQGKEKKLVAQIAPAVRVGVGEGFGVQPGDVSPKQLVTALRKLGFHYVFDTLFTADVTILEEGTELLNRLKNGELQDKPMFTSCCPGWIALAESKYPEVLPYISTTKSPQMIMGAVVKHIFSGDIGLKPEDLYMVSFMPCVRKQGEADRPGFGDQTSRDVDLVITTAELVNILKTIEVDLTQETESEFDRPFGEGTGSAAMFGKSGGVMTAALRYAYYVLTGEILGNITFTPMEGFLDVMESSLTFTPSPNNSLGFPIEPLTLKIAVVAGLGGAKKFLKAATEGKVDHKFVEIMACAPYGCLGGGGQIPVGKNKEILKARKDALTAFDDDKTTSQDNTAAIQLYQKHLGNPGGHKSHELFHTVYEDKQKNQD